MLKTIIAIAGVLLFVVGLVLAIGLLAGALRAASLDDTKTIHAMIGDDVPPFCTWEASLSERVMTQNTSQAVLVKLNNPADRECQSTIALRAPGFEISPMREEQKIALAAGATGSLSWIVSPRRTGTYQIAVSDILNTQILGVTVKDEYGLTATQAKLLALVGSVLGPMLTVPWWHGDTENTELSEEVPDQADAAGARSAPARDRRRKNVRHVLETDHRGYAVRCQPVVQRAFQGIAASRSSPSRRCSTVLRCRCRRPRRPSNRRRRRKAPSRRSRSWVYRCEPGRGCQTPGEAEKRPQPLSA
ncbi:MAG: hypothetical protein MUC51_00830, partial [Anaerolineae bacterium]|nr:hypothetical protein [Anaerolineae bacterium]